MAEKWCILKHCKKCGSKLASPNGHSLCLLWLGKGHQVDTCLHCTKFSKKTWKNRAAWLQAALLLPALVLTTMASMLVLGTALAGQHLTQTEMLTPAAKATVKDETA